jgi:hypothetical protein
MLNFWEAQNVVVETGGQAKHSWLLLVNGGTASDCQKNGKCSEEKAGPAREHRMEMEKRGGSGREGKMNVVPGREQKRVVCHTNTRVWEDISIKQSV